MCLRKDTGVNGMPFPCVIMHIMRRFWSSQHKIQSWSIPTGELLFQPPSILNPRSHQFPLLVTPRFIVTYVFCDRFVVCMKGNVGSVPAFRPVGGGTVCWHRCFRWLRGGGNRGGSRRLVGICVFACACACVCFGRVFAFHIALPRCVRAHCMAFESLEHSVRVAGINRTPVTAHRLIHLLTHRLVVITLLFTLITAVSIFRSFFQAVPTLCLVIRDGIKIGLVEVLVSGENGCGF